MKLIDLHKEWCEAGELPDCGLCYSLPPKYKKLLKEFVPSEIEKKEEYVHSLYWGCGDSLSGFDLYFNYTPLRQTIVLLICAMKGELK